jgi:hypothetical protein
MLTFFRKKQRKEREDRADEKDFFYLAISNSEIPALGPLALDNEIVF